MRIKKVKCEQFAGIRNKELEFTDGLNLIIGANESGKSTMVDLMYQLLFQPAKQRKDSEFIRKYFSKTKDGKRADHVDGSLWFETEAGSFWLEKEWEYNAGSSKLQQPNGISLKKPEEIETILEEQLKFKEGVYREIVFPSQKREQWVLDTLLNGLSKDKEMAKVRDSLEETLTKAALETGGISLGKIEEEIQKKRKELISHWDEMMDEPEGGKSKRGLNHKWNKEVGKILEAWYLREEINAKREEVRKAENELERCSEELKQKEEEKKKRSEEQERYRSLREWRERRRDVEVLLREQKKREKECMDVLERWPSLKKVANETKELVEKIALIEKKRQYEEVQAAHTLVLEKQKLWESLGQLDEAEIAEYQRLDSEKRRCEQQLVSGKMTAKLVAQAVQMGENKPLFRSLISGELLEERNGCYYLDGAVEMEIPNVLRMQFMPSGVDSEKVLEELKQVIAKMEQIEQKYQIRRLEELWEKKKQRESLWLELQNAKAKLERELNGKSLEDIKKCYSKEEQQQLEAWNLCGTETETKQLQTTLRLYCGAKSVDAYLGGIQTQLELYEKNYGSEVALQKEVEALQQDLKEKEWGLESLQKVSEKEFNQDFDALDQKLTKELKELEIQIGDLKKQQGEAETRLNGEAAEEYDEEWEECNRTFEAKKAEYKRWSHIQKIFEETKQETSIHPTHDLAERFAEYLKQLSDGRLALTWMDEKLNTSLTSGNFALAVEYLSEGTKDTILLAFRLAMLEHLFPEGGGLAVFDDPFTDMDSERLRQACSLIQHFAKKNQVIFVTCNARYQEFLDANVTSLA